MQTKSTAQLLPQRLCLLAIILALVVVSMGAWTRLNNAGLGCPDWPGCYGQLVVPQTQAEIQQAAEAFSGAIVDVRKGMIEMVHRYLATLLGFVVMLLAWIACRRRDLPAYPQKLSYALLALVILQGMFGMWTVTLKLLPVIVTLHLFGGLLTLSLLIILYQRLGTLTDAPDQQRQTPVTASMNRTGLRSRTALVMAGLVFLYLQLLLGGWTSANYAGWSCPHWLSCAEEQHVALDFSNGFDLVTPVGPNYEGGMLPLEARAAIQMTHRVVAVLLCAYLIFISLFLYTDRQCRRPLLAVMLVVFLQIGLGVGNIIFGLPLGLAMAHHSGAVLLLMCLLWLYQRVNREVRYATE